MSLVILRVSLSYINMDVDTYYTYLWYITQLPQKPSGQLSIIKMCFLSL